jgi:hypothetical protein
MKPVRVSERIETPVQADPTPTADPCLQFTDPTSCDGTQGCVWCKSAAVPSKCFNAVMAKKLPPSIFKCDFAEAPFVVDPTPTADPCLQFTDPTSCDGTQGCVWCKSAAVPSKCFNAVMAKKLPPSIFHCDFAL